MSRTEIINSTVQVTNSVTCPGLSRTVRDILIQGLETLFIVHCSQIPFSSGFSNVDLVDREVEMTKNTHLTCFLVEITTPAGAAGECGESLYLTHRGCD